MTREEALIEMIKGKKIVHPDCQGHYEFIDDRFVHVYDNGNFSASRIIFEHGYELKKEIVKKEVVAYVSDDTIEEFNKGKSFHKALTNSEGVVFKNKVTITYEVEE